MNESNQQTKILKFSAQCTLDTATKHYQTLLEAIHSSDSVELDLTDIKQADASFIQLLVTAQLEAKRFKTNLKVKGTSEVVNDLATHMFCHVSLIATDTVSRHGE